MRAHIVLGFLFIVLPHLVLDYGCSLVGFGLGSIVDKSTSKKTYVAGSSAWQMDQLDSIRVKLKDGTTMAGTNPRPSVIPEMAYEKAYELAFTTSDIDLPRLHDSVLVTCSRGVYAERTVQGEFLGFGIDNRPAYSLVKIRREAETKSFPLHTVELLTDNRGKEWTGRDLSVLISAGRAPLHRGVILNSESSDTLLAVCDIDSILVVQESSWKWVGGGIGAAADITVLILLSGFDAGGFDIGFSSSRAPGQR